MVINGVDRHFELNVKSHREICENLPNKDFSKLTELFSGSSLDSIDGYIMLACAMNRGYEDHKHYEDPEYKQNYLEASDFDFFSLTELGKLEQELTDAITGGMATEIEVATPKGKKRVKAKV